MIFLYLLIFFPLGPPRGQAIDMSRAGRANKWWKTQPFLLSWAFGKTRVWQTVFLHRCPPEASSDVHWPPGIHQSSNAVPLWSMVVSWVEQAPQDHTQLEDRSSPLPEKSSGSTVGGGSSLGTRSSFLPGAKRSCAFFPTTGP